jgi:phage repressor protein C with HTH and peptisase S24 domain
MARGKRPRLKRGRWKPSVLAETPAYEAVGHEAFAARLLYLIQRTGSALALAKAAGVSDSAISSWLGKSEPSRKALIGLADATGVRVEWLATGRGPIESTEKVPKGFIVPRQGYRALADLQPPIAFSYTYLMMAGDPTYAFPDDLLLAFATGDAMAPTIGDQDLLLIDTARKEKEDGVCVALQQDGDLIVRRLQRRTEGGFYLLCDNHRYPPSFSSDLSLVGRVIWRAGKVP